MNEIGGSRVVFLVDVSCAASDVQSYHRSLCCECTKVLFSLSVFPSRKCVKWKLLPIRVDEPVAGRVPPFVDLTLDSMKALFKEIGYELFKNVDKDGCLWDSPDIYSPPKRKLSRVSDPMNIIFVCSRCPERLQQIVSNDLHACLLKQNVHLICLSEKGVIGEKVAEIMPLLRDVTLPFIEPIPQPASVIFSHQTSFARPECTISGNPEMFWLCTSTEGSPLCVVEVEPVLTSVPHCTFMSSIQNCNLAVGKCDTPQYKFVPKNEGNFAVMIGVIREVDVNSSYLQMSYSSFTCTGLCVHSSSFDTSDDLQQNGLETSREPKPFSQEYQHLCVNLASNKLCLLLQVRTNTGDTAWCILQPLWSVMSLLTVLKPLPTCDLESTLSTSNPWDSNIMDELYCVQHLSSKCITYPELYYKLAQSDCGSTGNLDEAEKAAIFDDDSLLPWYPFSEHQGLSSTCFQHIKELQKSVKSTRIAEVTGKELMKIVPLQFKDNAEGKRAPKSANTDDYSLDEIFEFIAAGYTKVIKSCSDCLQLQEWVANNLCKVHVEVVYLLPKVSKYLLLSAEQLEQKYAKGLNNNEEKMTEYLLQVLLRLEVNHIAVGQLKDLDINILATEVTHLLRKISLMAKPSFLGQLMKEVILPNYSATCQKMLLSVYEELLLPVPVELGGSRMDSPQREDAKADSVSSNDDERSVGQQLVNDVSSAPVKTVTMHSFMRHASFQDQRKIIMPAQKPKRKKGEAKDSKDIGRRVDLSPVESRNKDTTEQTSVQAPRMVCRTLFKRSMSLNVDIGCKRQCDEDQNDTSAKRNKVEFVVKETPVKKQVENYRRYKLQRLRSKMDVSDAKVVDVVEESPRRSFYSSSSRTRPSTSHMKELLEGRITQAVGDMTLGSWKPEASSHCLSSYDNENPLIEETNIVAESPSSSDWQSTKTNSTLLQTTLTSDDPSVFGDSASMVAFALSTPTKDDKFNFENALDTF